jgi:hypothetical protein
MNTLSERLLNHDEQDLLAAMRLRPAQTLPRLAAFMDAGEYHVTVTALRLARMGFAQHDAESNHWFALDRGVPVTESILSALLNESKKGQL